MEGAQTVKQERMSALIRELAIQEELTESLVQGVKLLRISYPCPRQAVVYTPLIIVIGQGSKRFYVGNQVCTCDAHNYLVVSVPLPLECEVDASPAVPLLGLIVPVTPAVLGELLAAMDGTVPLNNDIPKGIDSLPLSDAMSDAVIRLLECLRSPEDSVILGRQYLREIIYHVLRGEQGGALQALATKYGYFNAMSGILTRIHEECAAPLDVRTLARDTGMSLSAFYRAFRSLTSSSPLQYVKSLRLHKARALMVQEGFNAGTAAGKVGYQSASQFSREFRRFFGHSPVDAAARVRAGLSLPGVGDLSEKP